LEEKMPGVLDAETHIAESEAMWSHIEKEMYPRRPVLATIPDDTWYKERNAFWLIDGEIFPKPAGKRSYSLITPSAQKKESGRETSISPCANSPIHGAAERHG
jgi:hypothetical protein